MTGNGSVRNDGEPGARRRCRPIVVCGAARSGTTALNIMLNQHAEIQMCREIELEKLPSLRPLLAETAAHHGNAWTEQRRAMWLGRSGSLQGARFRTSPPLAAGV
jgi:hypothetical protein